ncbi:MAG: GlsB/YeaQ/YmgE family stress response membrane protein [Actinomycetota bacterium]|nr:GlsB/YeaQ/YmgE family stress response membrane protein [Actinomycetota bacterium]
MLVALIAILVLLLIVLPIIGIALWALVSVGFVGVIIGGLARLVLPGRQNIGLLATVLLGWIGSMIGGFIGYHVIHTGSVLTVLLEIGVAALLVAGYSGSRARTGSRGKPSLR